MNYKIKLLKYYNDKNYSLIINLLENNCFKNKNLKENKIFNVNILACSYINIKEINKALNLYKIAIEKIKNFDGPQIFYNIGILPENIVQTDKLFKSYINKNFNKKLNKKELNILTNSLKINPNLKGAFHSNLGLSLINLIKISKKIKKSKFEEIFYLNYKYNSYRAEMLLKKRDFKEFKNEVRKIIRYNSVNMRLFSILSYAIQKYKIKNINYFCKNPFDYLMQIDLKKNEVIDDKKLKKINSALKMQSQHESFQAGSIYNGYKSVGDLFDNKDIEIQSLKKIFLAAVKKYLNFYKSSNEKFIKDFPKKNMMKGWYVRIKKGGGIDYHIHNSWLSGVFYCKIPSTSKDGKLNLSIVSWEFKKEKRFLDNIIPIEGKLVLFPSSMPHKVAKFNNTSRVSIAFDIIPTV